MEVISSTNNSRVLAWDSSEPHVDLLAFPGYDPEEPMVAKQFCTDELSKEHCLISEIEHLLYAQHPYVVPLRGMVTLDPSRCEAGYSMQAMLMPEAEGDLYCESLSLTPEQACRVLAQLLLALEYIHGRGLVHSDLKPANVLLFRDLEHGYQGKLCDFGGCQELASRLSSGRTTAMCRSPEHLLGSAPDAKCDLWGMGHIAYYLITGVNLVRQKHVLGYLFDGDVYTDANNLVAIYGSLPGGLDPWAVLAEHRRTADDDLEDLPQHMLERGYQPEATFATYWEQIQHSLAETERVCGIPGHPEMIEQLLQGLLAVDPERRLSASDALELPIFHSHRAWIQDVRSLHRAEPIVYSRPPLPLPETCRAKFPMVLINWVCQHVRTVCQSEQAGMMAYASVIPITTKILHDHPEWRNDPVKLSQIPCCAMAIAHKRFPTCELYGRCAFNTQAIPDSMAMEELCQMESDLIGGMIGSLGEMSLLTWEECASDKYAVARLIRSRAIELLPEIDSDIK